ncbi:MAG: CHASE2 domain-containing protein [Leptolyngbyaceae cyanobacterium]
MSVRALGSLEMLELWMFDTMLALRPSEPSDQRIVIIGITDADLDQYLGTSSISDQLMADLIQTVQSHRPRIIGLDFYRNLPNEPGAENLATLFENTSNLIGIEKVIADRAGAAIPGNALLKAADKTAASDIVADADGRVRKGILFPATTGPNVVESLGLRLALGYLASEPRPVIPEIEAPVLTLDNVQFFPIESNTGGYVDTDAQGYQILLNFRQRAEPFQMVSLRQVLQNEIPPTLMRDRIVLIGSMALSNGDIFYTANRPWIQEPSIKFGVELHGEIASQILSTVLDNRPLLYVWPRWVEMLIVIGITTLGGHLGQRATTLWQRLTLIPGASLLLVGMGYMALCTTGLWLPVIPSLLGLWMSAGLTNAYRTTQLQVLSAKDRLTGLANRRTFDETLQQVWFKALRSQQPIALILGDVDHFKKYNDTYGHPQGDDCLKRVAQAIRITVRSKGALSARYGGEEFVVLLPNTSADSGIAIAYEILTKLNSYQLPHAASSTSSYVTMSLGVTSFIPTLEIPPSALVEMADLGLYTAKESGRNCVRLHQPDTLNKLSGLS